MFQPLGAATLWGETQAVRPEEVPLLCATRYCSDGCRPEHPTLFSFLFVEYMVVFKPYMVTEQGTTESRREIESAISPPTLSDITPTLAHPPCDPQLMCCYAVVGVHLFAKVALQVELSIHANFQTFAQALTTLFR